MLPRAVFILFLLILLSEYSPMYTLAIPVRLSVAFNAFSSPPENSDIIQRITPLNLPKQIDGWMRPDEPLVISHEHLSDVLDSAAELYLSYRVDCMEVYEYEAEGQGNLLLELNWTKSSEDAFGLFSLDWTGETVYLGVKDPTLPAAPQIPSSRALYKAGLLRFWSGRLYARIMAFRETEESKKAVLELGQLIVQNCETSNPPSWLEALTPSAPGWNLVKDQVLYLRSHTVLNSYHYLGNRNLFLLGENDEAVFAPYEKAGDERNKIQIKALCIRYEEANKARRAYENFVMSYLEKEIPNESSDRHPFSPVYAPLAEGWTGCAISEHGVSAVFQAPEREDAQALLESLMVGTAVAVEHK